VAQNDVLQQQVQTFQVTSEIQSLKEREALSRVEDEKNKLLIANVTLNKQVDELALAVEDKVAIETKLLKEQEVLNHSIDELVNSCMQKG
jgi:hypothetical protein